MVPWSRKGPLWHSCGPAELECVVGDQSSMVLMEKRWSMGGGQSYACVVPAGLWESGKTKWLECLSQISFKFFLALGFEKVTWRFLITLVAGAYLFKSPPCVTLFTAPFDIWLMTCSLSSDIRRMSDLVLLRRFFHLFKSCNIKKKPKTKVYVNLYTLYQLLQQHFSK